MENRPELKVIIDGIEYEPKPKPLLADAKVGDIAAVETKHGNIVYKPIFHVTDDYVYAGENGKINVGYKYRKIDGINELDNRFKIVSFEPLASEGSAEWALYQMMQGKKVVSINGTVYWQDKDDNDLIKYADGYGQIWVQTPYLFLRCVDASGWQLYKEQRYSCLFYEEGAPVSTVKSLSGSQIKRIMEIMKEGENA